MSAPRSVFRSWALERGGARPPADLIEQSEHRALQKLIERGSMTPHEITESVEIDQFDLPFAQAWVESALQRGFIAKTGGSNASTRYNIMPAWAERGPRYHRTLRCW